MVPSKAYCFEAVQGSSIALLLAWDKAQNVTKEKSQQQKRWPEQKMNKLEKDKAKKDQSKWRPKRMKPKKRQDK